MNIKQKITAAAATGALLASVLLPGTSFASTNVTIKNNGSGSINKVRMMKKNMRFQRQSNRSIVITGVGVFSNTGGNSANGNTRGNVTTRTGNANTTVSVDVRGNRNTITPSDCECDEGNTNVTIQGNGRGSRNSVRIRRTNFSRTSQSNSTFVVTGVITVSNTGGNSANGNTGGSTTTNTGNVSNTVNVTVGGSSNTN